MRLTTLDWAIVLASIVVSFAPAVWLARRAGSSTAEFFTSGRAAPWWLIGISMVATTFSTDTPNLVTNLVREGGVSANWVWWAFLLTGMTTVFFYARLWRRLGVLTDLEFYELRYSGRAASWVRGFRAIYLGFFFNVIIMATVTLAAAKIANVLLAWPLSQTLIVCSVLNIVFAATSGLWGVLVTDLLQFGLAMAGSVIAAAYALDRPEVGGLAALMARTDPRTLSMLPDWSNGSAVAAVFIIPLTVQWWATWYPGSEPGGGSYIAQRMLAARSEREALSGTLLFTVAHYALRPWPWIVVALSSMLVFPQVADIQRALPHVDPALLGHDMAYSAMLTFLPAGLLGMIVAGLVAAYVSTMSTHLNWGTSYLVHDFYRRFLRSGAEERHYVLVGRLVTVALMIAAALVTPLLGSARRSFDLMLSIGAGTGLLYLLRWFWWRINAWSEIAAMVSSFVIAVGLFGAAERGFALSAEAGLLLSVGITTAVWLAATFLTPATDATTLVAFYRRALPGGPGWRNVRREAGNPAPGDDLRAAALGCAAGCALVYSALFGSGSALVGQWTVATAWALTFGLSAVVLVLGTAPLMSATKAVVLARGLGRRMREPASAAVLTASQERAAAVGSKVLMPVGDAEAPRPFLDYVLSSLADAGIADVAIVIGPDHAALRRRYEHEATPSRLRLTCVIQSEPRGTADAVLAAADWVEEAPFLAINGDNLYPAAALQALRDLDRPGVAGFSRAGLAASGDVAADRVSAFAVMRRDADGSLVEVIEKPSPAVLAGIGENPIVSMNCWRFDTRIFTACRDVPLSTRGELELPAAVNLAVARGVRFTVISVEQPVLDVSRRGDVADVSRRLARVVPHL